MNDEILRRWNSRIRPHDLVYHLGDITLGKPAEAIELLNQLNGQIYLIRGNHDSVARHRLCRDRFEWIKDYKCINPRLESGQKQSIVLCHYAFRVWDQMHRGRWHLYGHSHGNLPETGGLCFDVGVDNWNFWPIHLEEVAMEMEQREIVLAGDHHTHD
jgi:calcineurin-like phosphoesterase family protein